MLSLLRARYFSCGHLARRIRMSLGEREQTRRRLSAERHLRGALLALTLIWVTASLGGPTVTHAATDNAIVLENQQPGSNGWMWSGLADDVTQQIKGYASTTSVNQNESITFYVTVNPAQTYTI